MFESGSLDGQNDKNKRPEQINIEGRPATKNLRERFEKGELGGSLDDQKEVDEVFRNSGKVFIYSFSLFMNRFMFHVTGAVGQGFLGFFLFVFFI